MEDFATYYETKAHEIYWVRFADRRTYFSNNPYILDDGEEVILCLAGAVSRWRAINNYHVYPIFSRP